MHFGKAILAALLFLTVTIGGCAEAGETAATIDHDDDDGNHTMEPIHSAPAIVTLLTVDSVNGTAPLLVNFTLEGAPNATWSLDMGDGNVTESHGLPAVANHTYSDGDFVATLTVIDGQNITTSSVNVTALVGYVSGAFIQATEWTGSGNLLAGVQYCGLEDGVDYGEYIWDASALLAEGYSVANVVLTTTNGDTAVDIDFDFVAPDGTLIGHAGSFEGPGGQESVSGAGPYPAGEFVLQVSACSGVDMDFDWVMTADLITL